MKIKLLSLAVAALVLCGLAIAATQVPANPGLIVTHKTVTGAYTNSYSDYFVACAGASYAVTLPPVSDGREGCTFRVAAVGTNTVTLTPAAGDTIAGSTNTVSISTHTSLVITSDGVSDWQK